MSNTSPAIARFGSSFGSLCVAMAALLFAGCSINTGNGSPPPATIGKRVTYADAARHAYVQGLERFYDDNCLEAEPLMRNVRRQYPYSRFAALADLRVADCNFKDEKFPEAIEAYNQFVRYRPSHPEVPYARFMAARANFAQVPSEWLLSPPAYERDLHYADESLRLLRRMVLDFPDDPLVPRAQRLAEEATDLLAAHELYVARFYLDREFPRAAAGRLNTLLRSFPGTGHDPEALFMLGESYQLMRDPRGAKQAWERLITRYPDNEYAARAKAAAKEIP
jgi:outer membrane protein assembly factor BamD